MPRGERSAACWWRASGFTRRAARGPGCGSSRSGRRALRAFAVYSRKSPSFVATTVLTLAVALSLLTVVFTISSTPTCCVRSPSAIPGALHVHTSGWRTTMAGSQFRWRDYEALRERRDLFEEVGRRTRTRRSSRMTRPAAVDGRFVSENYFETLGLANRMLLGRALAGSMRARRAAPRRRAGASRRGRACSIATRRCSAVTSTTAGQSFHHRRRECGRSSADSTTPRAICGSRSTMYAELVAGQRPPGRPPRRSRDAAAGSAPHHAAAARLSGERTRAR